MSRALPAALLSSHALGCSPLSSRSKYLQAHGAAAERHEAWYEMVVGSQRAVGSKLLVGSNGSSLPKGSLAQDGSLIQNGFRSGR
eukprot:366528-Chlamydomonas_euryale.AAC.11